MGTTRKQWYTLIGEISLMLAGFSDVLKVRATWPMKTKVGYVDVIDTRNGTTVWTRAFGSDLNRPTGRGWRTKIVEEVKDTCMGEGYYYDFSQES